MYKGSYRSPPRRSSGQAEPWETRRCHSSATARSRTSVLGKSLDLQVSNFEFEPVEHELAGQIQAHYHVAGLDLGAQLGVTYQKHFGMPNASVQVQWHFPDTGYRNPGKQPGTSRY